MVPLRNSVHNHGIYYPKSMRRAEVTTYVFEVGKRVDEFIGWSLLIQLADDVRAMFVEILRDPVILALPHTPEFPQPPVPPAAAL